MIEAFVDNFYDNGQCCEQMGTWLGFLNTQPVQLEFEEGFAQAINLVADFDDQDDAEIQIRIARLASDDIDYEIRKVAPDTIRIYAYVK